MKHVLIIGGSRGIGADTVRQFSQAGWRVSFTYCQSQSAAQALAQETGAAPYPCDTRREEALQALAQSVPAPDALIYNAGVAWSGLLQDMTAAAWDDLFSVNLRGAFLACKYLLPGMISRKAGNILLISSMWGEVGASCEAAYSASKAGLIGLAKALAKEVGPSQVRVNCLTPGVIQTDMLSAYSPQTLADLAEGTPLGRLGAGVDVAKAALFLSGEEAAFITGQVMGVNGGFVI